MISPVISQSFLPSIERTEGPVFKRMKRIWTQIQTYLSKENPDPFSFYQYLKEKGSLSFPFEKAALDSLSDLQKKFVEETILKINSQEKQYLVKELQHVQDFYYTNLDRLCFLLSRDPQNLSIEMCCSLGLIQNALEILMSWPVTDESFERFAKGFVSIKDKDIQPQLLKKIQRQEALSPYVEYLKERHYPEMYALFKRELQQIAKEDHEFPKDYLARSLFIRFCLPQFLSEAPLELYAMGANQWVSQLEDEIQQIPVQLRKYFKEMDVVTKEGTLKHELTSLNTRRKFANALRLLGRECECPYDSAWKSELSSEDLKKIAKHKKTPKHFTDFFDIGLKWLPSFSSLEQWEAKDDLEFFYFTIVLKEITTDKSDLVESWIYEKVDKIQEIASTLDPRKVKTAMKEKVDALYKEFFSQDPPPVFTTYETYLLFKKQWKSLYSSVKSRIVDPLYAAIAEEAYIYNDIKMMKALQRDLNCFLIPGVQEAENFDELSLAYKNIEEKIKAKDRKVLPHFIRHCLGKDPSFFKNVDLSLKEFEDFIKRPGDSLVKKFFKSKKLIDGDSILVTLDRVQLFQSFQSLKHFLLYLLKAEAKKKGVELPAKVWTLNEIEDLYQRLMPIDLNKIEREVQIDFSWAWDDFTKEKCQTLYEMFAHLGVKWIGVWSLEMNFLAQYKMLYWFVNSLKSNMDELFHLGELENKKRELDEYVELGDLKGINALMVEVFTSIAQKSLIPKMKDSLKVKVTRPITCDFSSVLQDAGWEWAQNSSFRYSVGLFKDSPQTSISIYQKMALLSAIFETFYARSLGEIRRLEMPSIYEDLLKSAVALRDTKACDWIFQKIAYQRYVKRVTELRIEGLPSLENSAWSIGNIIRKTKIMLEASGLDSAIRNELLWTLDSFPPDPLEMWTQERLHVLKTKGNLYLKEKSQNSTPFQSYLKNKGFPSKIRSEADVYRFYNLYRVFVDQKIRELEVNGPDFKKGLISDLENIDFVDIERLDQIVHVMNSQDIEEFVLKSVKSNLVHSFTRLLHEKLITIEKFQEVFQYLCNRAEQKAVLQGLFKYREFFPYSRYLLQKGGESILQIGYQALEGALESGSMRDSEIYSMFFHNFLRSSQKESVFFQEIDHSVETIDEWTDWLNGEGQGSLIKQFFEGNQMFGRGGFFASASRPHIKKSIVQCLEFLKGLNAISGKVADLSDLNTKLIENAYRKLLQSLPKEGLLKKTIAKYYSDYVRKTISLEDMLSQTKTLLLSNEEGVDPGLLATYMEKSIEINQESVKGLFPWKPLKNETSALSKHICEMKLNSFLDFDLLDQYQDGQDYVEELTRLISQKQKALQAQKEAMTQNQKEALNAIEAMVIRFTNTKDMDLLSELVDALVQLECDMTGKEREEIEEGLFPKWKEKAEHYKTFAQTLPTDHVLNSLKEGVEISVYELYRCFRNTRKIIFTILKAELELLNFPPLYDILLALAEQAYNEEYVSWIISKVIYARYEKALKDSEEADDPTLDALSKEVKDLPTSEKIERTRQILSSKKAPFYSQLLEALADLPWRRYILR